MNWLRQLPAKLVVAANVSTAAGVVFAGAQLWQGRQVELRKNAVDAAQLLYAKEFSASYRRIIDRVEQKDTTTAGIEDDLNYVVGIYDHVAIMYFSGILDKKIIEDNLGEALPRVVSIMESHFHYPAFSLKNMKKLEKIIKDKNNP